MGNKKARLDDFQPDEHHIKAFSYTKYAIP